MRVQGVQLPLDESSESTPTAGCIDGVIAGVTVHIVDIHHGGLEIRNLLANNRTNIALSNRQSPMHCVLV